MKIKTQYDITEHDKKTNDLILGVLMFWCIISSIKELDKIHIDYFNSKFERYFNYTSTYKQMKVYLDRQKYTILDDFIDEDTIKYIINSLNDIYGIENLNYQLHMYGGGTKSGDFWLDSKTKLIEQFDSGIFSIIASSNGCSIVNSENLKFINTESIKRLHRYITILKINNL